MYPVEILKPVTLKDALAAFRSHEDAMFLSGGMTLVPSMKAHLAAPPVLIDLSGIEDMTGIIETETTLKVGAMTRLAEMARSSVVATAIPELARMATIIADRHVRNRGTIGGSVANNDPAADYPAAVLGLGARLITDRRAIPAEDYFTGLFETALADDEILVAIELPKPLRAAYEKYAHPASGYAVAGVFIGVFETGWRVAVTGSGTEGVFRLSSLEEALATMPPAQAMREVDFTTIEVMDDPNFPAAFRQNAIRWLARDALARINDAQIVS